ncbi:MAG: sterol desaturase family protein [Candidatus Eisenbacteria bacterium]
MKFEDLVGLMIPGIYLVMLVLEGGWAARRFPQVRLWKLRGAVFTLLMIASNALLPLALPTAWLDAHRLFDLRGLGIAVGALVGYLGLSFVNYWVHRAEHRLGSLWRLFHQLHHSAERVDVSGAAYTHPSEMLLMVLVNVCVTVLVLGLDPRAAAVTGLIGAFYSMFQHWNIRTPRWLGYFIQRPESHCLHHEFGVHGRNYGDLPLWDLVFGTFANPRSFEGRTGFRAAASRRVGAMLLGIDVNRDAPSEAGFGPVRATS